MILLLTPPPSIRVHSLEGLWSGLDAPPPSPGLDVPLWGGVRGGLDAPALEYIVWRAFGVVLMLPPSPGLDAPLWDGVRSGLDAPPPPPGIRVLLV